MIRKIIVLKKEEIFIGRHIVSLDNALKNCKHKEKTLKIWIVKNISLISSLINYELKIKDVEAVYGKLKVDILAEDRLKRPCVIEVQTGKSDNDHLGKFITYIKQSQAEIGIWIVSKIKIEHLNTIDMINEFLPMELFVIEITAIKSNNNEINLIPHLAPASPKKKQVKFDPEKYYRDGGGMDGIDYRLCQKKDNIIVFQIYISDLSVFLKLSKYKKQIEEILGNVYWEKKKDNGRIYKEVVYDKNIIGENTIARIAESGFLFFKSVIDGYLKLILLEN